MFSLRNAWSVWFCILLEHTEPCSNIFNLRKCQTLQKWKYKISLCKVFLWCLRWLLFWLFCTHHPSSHICIKCDCRPLPPSALRSGASHLLIHSHGHHEEIPGFLIFYQWRNLCHGSHWFWIVQEQITPVTKPVTLGQKTHDNGLVSK